MHLSVRPTTLNLFFELFYQYLIIFHQNYTELKRIFFNLSTIYRFYHNIVITLFLLKYTTLRIILATFNLTLLYAVATLRF